MKISTYSLGAMQTNCYILTDENTREAVVIDPADNCPKILQKLQERNLHVAYILLTHVHFDHILALEDLRDATHAPVGVHKDDAPALLEPSHSLMQQFMGITTPRRPAELLLTDGQQLKIGDSILSVLHTPGHTMGSVCYLTDDSLISGDTLFRGSIGRHDFYGGNFEQLQQSLQRLASLPYNYRVYPGHGASTWLYTERNNNIYMQ